jgi:hypothetical protein
MWIYAVTFVCPNSKAANAILSFFMSALSVRVQAGESGSDTPEGGLRKSNGLITASRRLPEPRLPSNMGAASLAFGALILVQFSVLPLLFGDCPRAGCKTAS